MLMRGYPRPVRLSISSALAIGSQPAYPFMF